MSRDLLYKPPVPTITPEEAEEAAKKEKAAKAAKAKGTSPANTATNAVDQTHSAHDVRTPAYRAAYFNKDTSGAGEVNLRQRNMQALRGSDTAADLKKVVLPPSMAGDVPDPGKISQAFTLMGVVGDSLPSLQSLLARQNAWVRGQGVTLEMLKARMKLLQQMVDDRKKALLRIKKMAAQAQATSPTLTQAAVVDGKGTAVADVGAASSELIQKTNDHASGMHQRLAKMLSVKLG